MYIKGEKYIKEYRISGSHGYRPISFALDDHRFSLVEQIFRFKQLKFDILQILHLPIIIIIHQNSHIE